MFAFGVAVLRKEEIATVKEEEDEEEKKGKCWFPITTEASLHLEQFSTECRKQSGTALVLLYYVL